MVADVQQKHNHCFVACVASMLCDSDPTRCNDPIALQEWIVSRFPEELQKGKSGEGAPIGDNTDWGGPAMANVIKGLSLAETVHFLLCRDPDEMFCDLKNGRFNIPKVILCSMTGEQHCWRAVSKVSDDLLVMNPAIGRKEIMDRYTFIRRRIHLLACDHAACFPHISPAAAFELSKYLR